MEPEWGKNGYVSHMIGHPETVRNLRGTIPPVSAPLSPLTGEDIPEDIKVYTMPDGGIDPYEFLNLKKPPANANE